MPPKTAGNEGDNHEVTEVDDLRKRIEEQFSVREKPYKTMQSFIDKKKVNRLTLESLS